MQAHKQFQDPEPATVYNWILRCNIKWDITLQHTYKVHSKSNVKGNEMNKGSAALTLQ